MNEYRVRFRNQPMRLRSGVASRLVSVPGQHHHPYACAMGSMMRSKLVPTIPYTIGAHGFFPVCGERRFVSHVEVYRTEPHPRPMARGTDRMKRLKERV